MAKFDFWQRHANPASGWSRVATAPFFAVTLWFVNFGPYTWIPFVIIIIWAIINPMIFRKPKKMDRWISKGVLAEQWWIQKMKGKLIVDYTMLCNIFALLAFIPSLVIAFLPWGVKSGSDLKWAYVFCSTISVLFKLWFVDRVVFQYDINRIEQKKQD
ncbi:MAG: hypothetical protein JW776_06865 [Candidatus Lokiarchaeota archaeon]|nr:hypothetical protein [Candidatus Lokiarchaeota archaeon]